MHAQLNLLIAMESLVLESKQLPKFWHGDEAHSSTSTAQLKPPQPLAQAHAYMYTPSTQVDPFTHG